MRFCIDPYSFDGKDRLASAITPIGTSGVALASMKLADQSFSNGKLTATIRAIEKEGIKSAVTLDLLNLALRLSLSVSQPLYVSNLNIPYIEVEPGNSDWTRVVFEGCYIDRVEISDGVDANCCPRFDECLIQELVGRISELDLPTGRFNNSVFESFSGDAGTTNTALDLSLPMGARVLITILKKLFVQSISGRKENALYRGLDGSHQAKVPAIIELLRTEGIIESVTKQGEPIWIPIRRTRPRVLEILNAPMNSSDALMNSARRI